MKRYTDVLRPPHAAAGKQSAGASTRSADAAPRARLDKHPDSAAVEAAAALIALAMQESQSPVNGMSGALARMAQMLSSEDAPGKPGIHGTQTGDDLARCHALFMREISVCIESLQFHDRLMQQLAQVRNLLASVAANTLPTAASGDSQSWQVLIENMRARFTSDSHRILFNLLLPVSGGHMSAPSLHANEGSVELF